MQLDIEKIYEAQAKTGKTLAELGFAKTTIQNIRKGKNVRPQTVFKFCKALDCEVNDIIKRGGDANDKADTNESH